MATGSPLTVFTWVWVALWIGALAAAIFVLFWRRDRLPERVRGLILFAGTSLVLGAAGYALFLKLAASAHAAVELRAADGFFGSLPRRHISSQRGVGRDLQR